MSDYVTAKPASYPISNAKTAGTLYRPACKSKQLAARAGPFHRCYGCGYQKGNQTFKRGGALMAKEDVLEVEGRVLEALAR